MAKKSAAAKSNVIQLRPAAAQKPIIIREKVQAAPTKKKGHKGGHKSNGSKSSVQDAMIGAGALAFIEKSSFGAMIPSLPIGGKAATIGIGLWLVGGKYKKYATGPLAVATYNAVNGMQSPAVQGWSQPGVAASF